MKPQQGFAVLLMMVLVAVGVFGAMAAWVASDPPPSKQSINRQVLAQAREALLAYVAVSGDPAKMLTDKTRLPCPDRIGDGVADTSASTCLATGETAFGLLPWSTLGLPPLRDADGECLWYAVSGDFKDAAPAATVRPVNADTDGRITVSDEAGRTLATQLVAVVFAPGTNLTQQARNAMAGGADKPCVTPSSNAIADAALYLDKIVLSGATINNAQPAPAASAPVTFVQLTGTVDKQSLLNDQLAWITSDDYAATATQRNAEVLKAAFNAAVATSGSGGLLPFAVDTPGGTCKPPYLYSGFLPSSCSYVNAAGTTITFTLDPVPSVPSEATLDGWPQQAFYAVAPGCAFDAPAGCRPALLTLPANPAAKAVLLMRGRRQSNPNCPLSPSTSTLNQLLLCIEGQNANVLSRNPTIATQTRTFIAPDSRPTSNDVLKELK
jgi:hypothetical protein